MKPETESQLDKWFNEFGSSLDQSAFETVKAANIQDLEPNDSYSEELNAAIGQCIGFLKGIRDRIATVAKDRIVEARYNLCKNAVPYYSMPIYSMETVPSYGCPTMGVDKFWRMYWNPEFVMSLDMKQIETIIWHEVEHLLRSHHERFEDWIANDPDRAALANIANDCEINDDISKMGGTRIEGGIYPDLFGYPDGLTSEEYLELLLKDQRFKPKSPGGSKSGEESGDAESGESDSGNEQGNGSESGGGEGQSDQKTQNSGSGSDSKPGKNPIGDRMKRIMEHLGKNYNNTGGSGADGISREWEEKTADGPVPGQTKASAENIIKSAAQEAKEFWENHVNPGSCPAGMARWYKRVLAPPKVDWKRELRANLNGAISNARGRSLETYSKANRRNGVPKPGAPVYPNFLGRDPIVSVCIDTSGSMSQEDLNRCANEVYGILKNYKGGITVITGDTQAGSTQTGIKQLRDIKMVGGGGTDMGALLYHAETIGKRPPSVIVILTDGYTPWWEESQRKTKAKVIVGLTRPGSREHWDIPGSAKVLELF
jgi:predicted metal-dependent peptidase